MISTKKCTEQDSKKINLSLLSNWQTIEWFLLLLLLLIISFLCFNFFIYCPTNANMDECLQQAYSWRTFCSGNIRTQPTTVITFLIWMLLNSDWCTEAGSITHLSHTRFKRVNGAEGKKKNRHLSCATTKSVLTLDGNILWSCRIPSLIGWHRLRRINTQGL